jgi:hypothetical protein
MALLQSTTPKRSRVRLLDVAPRGTLGAGHEGSIGAGSDVALQVIVPTAQSVDAIDVLTPLGALLFGVDKNGNVKQSGVPSVVQCVAQIALTAAQIKALADEARRTGFTGAGTVGGSE